MKLKYYLRGLGFGIFFTALICGTGHSTAKEPMTDSEIIQRAKELGMVEGTLADGKTETSEMTEAQELEKVIETVLETETVEIVEEESKTQEKTETEAVAIEESKNLKESTDIKESKETKESTVIRESKETKESTAIKESKETKESTAIKESKETKESTAIKESKETKESTSVKESSEKKADTSVATVTFTIPSGCGSYEVAKLLEENGLIKNAIEYDTFLCANDYDRKISSGTYQIPVGADGETIAKIITKTVQ